MFTPNFVPKTSTWRIIPVSKWVIIMVGKSPKDRIVPLPNGHENGFANGGY